MDKNIRVNRIKNGFTLIELLVVIAVIGVLATIAIGIINPLGQFQRARDGQRKSDLAQLQRVLEQYYNDYGSYPAYVAGTYIMFDKNGTSHDWNTGWSPYTNLLPKDPSSSQRYIYYAGANGQSYYIYAHLERSDDPALCNGSNNCISVPAGAGPNYCSSGASPLICNYGVSSSNVSP